MKKATRRIPQKKRNGFLTVIVVVALIITLAISIGMVRTLINLRNVSIEQDQRLQLEALASSYFDYASNKQITDQAYTGETISITPTDWQQSYPARITIIVSPENKELKVQTQSLTSDGEVIQSWTRT